MLHGPSVLYSNRRQNPELSAGMMIVRNRKIDYYNLYLMHFKLLTSLTVLAFCMFFSVRGQQGAIHTHTKVFYDFTFQTDSSDQSTRNTIPTVLLFNDSVSIFQPVRKLRADSAFLQDPLRTGIAFRYGKIDPTQFRVWKHAGVITTEEPLDGRAININNEIFSYEENLADLDWVLEDDTLMLAGYRCQKATVNFAGRIWEAWFTTEIPLYDGPYKFSGLPGLVILVQDIASLFRFEFVGIKKEPAEVYHLGKLRPGC